MEQGRHLALVGSTATGKSALALEMARQSDDLEIVSVDSMQVYRGMDIGTAKPTPAEQAEVPHHLIDLTDPDDDYTVSRFQSDCRGAMAGIEDRGHRALLVGGTGLYLRAAADDLEIPGQYPGVRAELDAEPDTGALYDRLTDLDPIAAERMEPTNRRRIIRALEVGLGSPHLFSHYGPGLETYPPTPVSLVGLRLERDALDQRIADRYAQQMGDGFLAEVERLAARPEGISRTARQALGYRELLAHVEDGEPLDESLDSALLRTRRFARRQERWFRRDPRITWYEAPANPVALALDLLRDWLAASGRNLS